MRTLPVLSVVLVLAAGFGGCAAEQSQPARVAEPPFLVPSAAIMGRRGGVEQVAAAGAILPSSDGEYDIERGEKVVYGAVPVGAVSTYTTYTFDAQAIGIPHTGSVGYRYRWVVQQGEQVP